jgi:hypothetical protein
VASKQGIFIVELPEGDSEHAMDGGEEEELCVSSFIRKGLKCAGRG